MQQRPGFAAGETLLAITTLSFDIAALEIWLPLVTGGRVELVESPVVGDPHALSERIGRVQPHVIQATPATFRMLLTAGWQGHPELRILCGGEALPAELVGPLRDRCGELWNMYGPTETTIWSTIEPVEAEPPSISIGRPIANTRIYVLDRRQQRVPIGVVGELYIGGEGLACGYRNRPELTAERFLADPFSNEPSGRMYRTGDLARFLPDGRLECLGRVDQQIKLRGFRIEPGEIEARLVELPEIEQAVVATHEPTAGDLRLVAWYTLAGNTSVSESRLRSYVRGAVPEYMVPSRFVRLDRFPQTPNGKVDRRRLPEPAAATSAAGAMIPHRATTSSPPASERQASFERIAGRARELEAQFAIPRAEEMPALKQALNDLCRAHVCRYLLEADEEFRQHVVRDIDAQRKTLGVIPAFRKFHEYMLRVLAEDGVIERRGGAFTVLEDPRIHADTDVAAERVRAVAAGFAGTIELLDHCGRHYRDVLSGEIPGISVLFVDGNREFLDQKLRRETVEHRNLRVYRRVAVEFVAELASSRQLRILEIGGGGGTLTWELAEALRGCDAQYTFTDIGPSIVAAARREAASRGLVSIDFRTLDITRDPAGQGFANEQFDIVLGLNVVHATPDLDDSLMQLTKLLVPGGILALIEYVRSPRWDDLIWGVTEGWWCFEDAYRDHIALTDIATWESVLHDRGFVDVRGIPAAEAHDRTDGALILAATPTAAAVPASVFEPTTASRVAAAPRDAYERHLCNLWQALLHVKPVGIRDDFFDLGGHSLLAVELVTQIERVYGKRLPLATLLEARTVAALANVLRTEDWQPKWNSLVPMRPGGTRPPLFLMHSHGGNVLEYAPLVEHLGEDQPVYALQARGLDGNIDPHPSISDMAAAYIGEIKALQPEGPYYLGGFCFGGHLALEVAQQFASQGDEVAAVVLIQTQTEDFAAAARGIKKLQRHVHRLRHRLALERTHLAQQGSRAQLGQLLQRLRRLGMVVRGRIAVATDPLLARLGYRPARRSLGFIEQALAAAHERAIANHTPPPYAGKVYLFRAEQQRRGLPPDPTLGLKSVLEGPIETAVAPGLQQTMLSEPHVRTLAARIAATLRESEPAEPGPSTGTSSSDTAAAPALTAAT